MSHASGGHGSSKSNNNTEPPRFKILKHLGRGGQGFVQLAYDNVMGQQVAIKYIDRGGSRGFYKYVLREILHHQQLSLCKHPHIVEFLETLTQGINLPRYLGVVMEYVDGRDLQNYLEKAGGRLSADVARFVFQQLMIAIDFCHRKGKVNRDIKPANILVVDSGALPLVKLCDFGFSKDKFDDSAPQTQIGTALYTAPEIFLNVQGAAYDAEAADVWSCGVVLCMLLYGQHPFLSSEDLKLPRAGQVEKLVENAVKGELHLPAEANNTPAGDLIRCILVPVPQNRYKLSQIMAHPWFLDKLPPGALDLNATYLSVVNLKENMRQSPDVICQIVRAAVTPPGQPISAASMMSSNSSITAPAPNTPLTSQRNLRAEQQRRISGAGGSGTVAQPQSASTAAAAPSASRSPPGPPHVTTSGPSPVPATSSPSLGLSHHGHSSTAASSGMYVPPAPVPSLHPGQGGPAQYMVGGGAPYMGASNQYMVPGTPNGGSYMGQPHGNYYPGNVGLDGPNPPFNAPMSAAYTPGISAANLGVTDSMNVAEVLAQAEADAELAMLLQNDDDCFDEALLSSIQVPDPDMFAMHTAEAIAGLGTLDMDATQNVLLDSSMLYNLEFDKTRL